MMGSMFMVFIGCGAWVRTYPADTSSENMVPRESIDVLRISLAFGLVYAAFIFCARRISEGHINSLVTIVMLITRKTSVMRAVLYFVCQILGSVIGASFLLAVTSNDVSVNQLPHHKIGCTLLGAGVTEGQGFGVEFFSSFFFIFIIFAAYDRAPPPPLEREQENKTGEKLAADIPESALPFIIGLTYSAVLLFAIPFSGGSINPARSFGPALVGGVWTHHWVYWFGPILGGVLGAVIYELVFSTQSSVDRLKDCLLVFHRNDSESPSHQPLNQPQHFRTSDSYKGAEPYKPSEAYKMPDNFDKSAPESFKSTDAYKLPDSYGKPADTYKTPDTYKPADTYKTPDTYKPVGMYGDPTRNAPLSDDEDASSHGLDTPVPERPSRYQSRPGKFFIAPKLDCCNRSTAVDV